MGDGLSIQAELAAIPDDRDRYEYALRLISCLPCSLSLRRLSPRPLPGVED